MSESLASCPACHSDADSIAAPRHIASWDELTAGEQFGILAEVGAQLGKGAKSFKVSTEGGHFRLVIEREVQSATRDVVRLTTGEDDPLLPIITHGIDGAEAVDLAVAFAMDSGIRLIEPWFRDLLQRGGRLRMVVGDYMDVTEPAALRRLSDLDGANVKIFMTGKGSFHPKAWLFRAAHGQKAAIVGSSNLSQTALTKGVEWNLHSESAADAVGAAFEALFNHPQARDLTPEWIDDYTRRRGSTALTELAQRIVSDEPTAPPPKPHEIQMAALMELQKTRRSGYRAGLVVLATGLGKTWLAAFDSTDFDRILFVAHREEILSQAMASFRRIRPNARFGRYCGAEKDETAEILFASIQTIGRDTHLRRFAADAFDYIIVDEFHHASADSYRGLLAHFTPSFMLGLTATPDRTDGKDLLELCGDNLVYHCDLFAGIDAGLLAPFRYLGVPDDVDYEHIPWRSNQFDPAALDAAVITEKRAANALEQFQMNRNGPAVGFCCSVKHAQFMSDYFNAQGVKAVAVYSDVGSAPRATSLEQLAHGKVDIVFSVDMFNEGVDVPNIGTILMLRPTESVIVWLQQFGRGLRRVGGKVLSVVDYVGNHRSFLTKLRALLSAGSGDQSLKEKLDQVVSGRLELPAGCSVTYDLQVIEMLRGMLRSTSDADDLAAQYIGFRQREGRRPTASEIAGMGFDPSRTGHGHWFDFVRSMGDEVDARAYMTVSDLLQQIEKDGSLKEPAINALRTMRDGGLADEEGLADWAFNPYLKREGNRLTLSRRDPTGAAVQLVCELADWRHQALPKNQLAEDQSPFLMGGLTLWTEYQREAIPPLFGTAFNPGNWNAGIVRVGRNLVLLTTLKKGSLTTGNHYEDCFISPDQMQWQSQTQTRRDSNLGRMLSGQEEGAKVHLFVRSSKLRNGKASPFIYCGQPKFMGWHGDKPITINWQLEDEVPPYLRKALSVPGN